VNFASDWKLLSVYKYVAEFW